MNGLKQNILKKNNRLKSYVLERGDSIADFQLKSADLVFPLIVAVQNLNQKVDELTRKIEEK